MMRWWFGAERATDGGSVGLEDMGLEQFPEWHCRGFESETLLSERP